MAGETYVLGMNAVIYLGTGTTTPLTNVRDVTLTMEAGEADITTRGNSGWRATAPTLRECTVEFEMVWKPSDTGFQTMKTAFLANSTVELTILDKTGGEGPHGLFGITSFSRNEALEEAITVNVTAKLASFTAWEGGGAS